MAAIVLPGTIALRTSVAMLLLICSIAHAASPVVSCTPSRTSGTAPLAVFMDCSGTTDADTTMPFHDLAYWHSMGDTNAGKWAYGANTSQSKNFAYGPLAVHVYESAGTFTWTTRVCDTATTCAAPVTSTITVTAADTTFATNTACVFNTSIGSGCTGTSIQSSDFDDAIATARGANGCGTDIPCKRIRFKGGDTFVASTHSTISAAGPIQVESYGTGQAKATSNNPTANGFILVGTTGSDLRIINMEFDGTGASGQSWLSFDPTAWTNVLVLNNYAHDLAAYLPPDWGVAAGSGFFAVGNRILNAQAGLVTPPDGVIIGGGEIVGILGNNIDLNGNGQQGVRFNHTSKYVSSNNTVTNAGSSGADPKETIAVRSSDSVASNYGVISYNAITLGTAFSYVGVYPSNAGTNLGTFDIIIEGNYIFGAASVPASGIGVNAERVTVRNNLISATDADLTTGISLGGTNGGQSLPAKDVKVYNNTYYSTTGGITGIEVDATASTGIVIKNNLINSTVSGTAVSDSMGVATKGTNTGDVGTVTTPPAFTSTSSPIGFRVSTGSYAYNAGTAIFPPTSSDFLFCSGATMIGAFIPAAAAQCRGVAGP